MENLYKHIGNKIRELRDTYAGKGLSQEALAKEMDTTANTVSRWESGIYKISAENLHRLANFFGVPISVFFPGMENTNLQVLLSATGNIEQEDIDELAQYAQFRKARRMLEQTKKRKKTK